MANPLVLPPELTIYTVGELRPQWLEWLDAEAQDAHGAVDGSAVEQVDAAGVQLLLSLSRSLAQRQMALRIAPGSRCLGDALDILGLSTLVTSATLEVAA
jgi:anti-anti-sigma regulatory factor